MAHYDEESLFEYVEGTSPIASEIDSHVSECRECAAEVGEHRELIATLSDKDVWESPAPAPRHAVANVVAFAERIHREDADAIVICDDVLTGPVAWWPQRLRKTNGANTAGVVKQLLERMFRTVETSPVNGLQMTTLAIGIANALDVSEYPCDYVVRLRAQALREHAQVLSLMGRYLEAVDFVDRARRLFLQTPLPEYDLARVAIVKAAILQHIDRIDEAAALAREAGDTFLRFGDRARHVNARITEGSVLFNAHSVDRALAIWQSVEHDAGLNETSTVRVAHNIALCLVDLGRPVEAIDYLVRCVADFEMLGMQTERTRSRWILTHALVVAGKQNEAIPALRQTWREFEQLDLVADAGLVALELADVLLSTGHPEEVPAICRDVISQFTRSGMASRAITALSFLREAVALGQASTSLVRHVHAFLRELPAEQPRLFAPPPSGFGE
ncbi:MAG TPA: tetratricopeptide repeat protein [Thermoanaerobaculia bacterium]|jgi:tetratricopeptide (TPR) repeat protein